MDLQDTLKENRNSVKVNPREFDSSRRFEYLSAVEYAARLMVRQLEGYLAAFEIGPEAIVVRGKFYQPAECLSILRREISRHELGTRIIQTNNGEKSPENSLEFDLDQMADQYFDLGHCSHLR